MLVLGFAIALGLKIGSGPARVWLFRKIPFCVETLKILTRKFLIKESTVLNCYYKAHSSIPDDQRFAPKVRKVKKQLQIILHRFYY